MSRYVGRQVPATSSPLYCRRLVRQFIEWQTVVLSPICPHVAEHIWKLLGKKGSVLRAGWPKTMQVVDEVVIKSSEYLMEAARDFRLKLKNHMQVREHSILRFYIFYRATIPNSKSLPLGCNCSYLMPRQDDGTTEHPKSSQREVLPL